MQNMIEVVRETDVLKRTAMTIMTVVLMMTPNFWAEGMGMVEGYLAPEVLISIILTIVGALCAVAGASALAARIAGMLSKLRKAIRAAGKIGEVIFLLFDKVDEVAKLIAKLSKALRRRIAEKFEGLLNKVNRWVRPTRKPTRFINGVEVIDQKTGAIFKGTTDLGPTLDRIKTGKKFPHRNDGSIYRNNSKSLPLQRDGYYREYVHPTPGISGPGPQRIIVGEGGELYYTPDHYRSFVPIN